MGNYRFRLSDMIPNAWFYKLKDMGRGRKNYSSSSSLSHLKRRPLSSSPVNSNSQKSTPSQPRYSYYINNQPIQRNRFCNPKSLSTQFPDPPRKSSSKKRAKRKTIYKPSPKPASLSNKNTNSDSNRVGFIPTYTPAYTLSFLFESPSETEDIIIDMDEEREPFARKPEKVEGFSLAPILTKSAKLANERCTEPAKHQRSSSKFEERKSRKDQAKTTSTSPAQASKSLSNSTGIRLRSNSPRIATTRKSVCSARNGPVLESFVVVKSSVDPKRDFMESMVEMIVENNIRASRDLEELLACYLSLNPNEYHDLIVNAFEDIWLDMTRLCS